MYDCHGIARHLRAFLARIAASLRRPESLADLDARTLRDLGIHPSEIESIGVESRLFAHDRTRLRVVADLARSLA